jgi:hypothetical protein
VVAEAPLLILYVCEKREKRECEFSVCIIAVAFRNILTTENEFMQTLVKSAHLTLVPISSPLQFTYVLLQQKAPKKQKGRRREGLGLVVAPPEKASVAYTRMYSFDCTYYTPYSASPFLRTISSTVTELYVVTRYGGQSTVGGKHTCMWAPKASASRSTLYYP